MYNPELKQKFIDQEMGGNKNNSSGLFSCCEPFEKEDQKDISEMTRERILSIFNQSDQFIPNTIRSYLASLNRYLSFLKNLGYTPNPRIYKTISPKDIDYTRIATTCFFSDMEEILNYSKCGTRTDEEIQCALSFVYLGVTLREAISLKTTQICPEKKEIYDSFHRTIISGGDNVAWDKVSQYKREHDAQAFFLPSFDHPQDECNPSHLTQKMRYYGKRITIAKTKSGCEKLKSINVWYSGALHRLLIADQLKMLTDPSVAKRTIQMCFPGIQMTTSDIMLMYNGYKAMIEEE